MRCLDKGQGPESDLWGLRAVLTAAGTCVWVGGGGFRLLQLRGINAPESDCPEPPGKTLTLSFPRLRQVLLDS